MNEKLNDIKGMKNTLTDSSRFTVRKPKKEKEKGLNADLASERRECG